jgi:hypothetical protein
VSLDGSPFILNYCGCGTGILPVIYSKGLKFIISQVLFSSFHRLEACATELDANLLKYSKYKSLTTSY